MLWLALVLTASAQDVGLADVDGLPAVDATTPWQPVLEPADGPDDQVWNGVKAKEGQLVPVVALGVGYNDSFYATFCTGTLIHPEWVLTAAHCLDGLDDITGGNDDLLQIYFGVEHPFAARVPFAQTNSGPRVVLHPDYDGSLGGGAGFDIGLVKLSQPVNSVPLVVLNDEAVQPNWVGRDVVHVGYGLTHDEGHPNASSGVQRYTVLPLVRYGEQAPRSWNDPDADLLYTYNGSVNGSGDWSPGWGDSTSNLCQGDSGGPGFEMFEDGTLEQVSVNAVVTGACANEGSGSTRVDLYIDWIREHVPTIQVDHGSAGDPQNGELDDLLEDVEEGPEPERGDLPANDLGEPPRPEDVAGFPSGGGCQQAPGGAAGWGLWAAATALVLGRRRRKDVVGL